MILSYGSYTCACTDVLKNWMVSNGSLFCWLASLRDCLDWCAVRFTSARRARNCWFGSCHSSIWFVKLHKISRWRLYKSNKRISHVFVFSGCSFENLMIYLFCFRLWWFVNAFSWLQLWSLWENLLALVNMRRVNLMQTDLCFQSHAVLAL